MIELYKRIEFEYQGKISNWLLYQHYLFFGIVFFFLLFYLILMIQSNNDVLTIAGGISFLSCVIVLAREFKKCEGIK